MSDPDIDRLYQVPLGEFTSARNALAKARGADGAAVKTLEKPTLPAWAVNQVYWQARKEWDALTEASMAVRQAHVQVISGRPADVATAEATHQRALRAAAATAQRLAEAAGEKVTGATAEVIMETLQALPSPDTPGMLTRPLKPLGFGALMAMGIPVTPTGGTTRATQHKPSAPVESPAARAKAREARKAAEKTLKKAEAAESAAEQTLKEAQSALTAAERELARVRDRLVFLEKQRSDADDLVRARRRELQDATNTRIQAAQDLAAGMD